VHFLRLQNVPDEFQSADYFTHRPALLMAVGDPRMSNSFVVGAQEIGVVTDNDATLRQREGYVVGVVGPEKTGFGGSGYINSATAKTVGNPAVDVLI
jgi:hypothetical protein